MSVVPAGLLRRLRSAWHLYRLRARLFYFLTALVVALTMGLPLVYMAVSSFKPSTEVYRVPPAFFPVRWVLDGYRTLLVMSNIERAFLNSMSVSVASSILALVLSIGFCYATSRFRLPGTGFFTYLVLFVYVLPRVLTMIPIYSVWAHLGVAEGPLPLIVTHVSMSLPFAIWMMRSFFAGVPIELEEAALVDGADRARAFLLIVLPAARPGIIATFIFTFILSWQEVLFASIFASTGEGIVISTLLRELASGVQSGYFAWNMVNAAGVVATLPVLIFFVLIQRHLVTGFTAGAIKG